MERRRFTREFKLEGVKLIKNCGLSCVRAAHDWGVHQSVLHIFVIPKRRKEHAGSKVSSTLIALVIDCAPDDGLSGLSVLMNTIRRARFQRYGWHIRPLELPEVHDNVWLIAVLVDVMPAALAGVRRPCELRRRSTLIRKGSQRPFGKGGCHVAAVA